MKMMLRPDRPAAVIGARPASGCCGGPAPAGVDACCVKDANAKAQGASGCGCGTSPAKEIAPAAKGSVTVK